MGPETTVGDAVAGQTSGGGGDGADLAAWVQARDQAAFARLVERHGGMVHATCRRILGDGQAADDACQATLVVLADRAATVRRPERLGAWLHRCAVMAARQTLRSTQSRARREERAMRGCPTSTEPLPDDDWEAVRPRLDEALAALPETARALLLRHFGRGETLVAAGAALGLSGEAARKQRDRSLAKLRRWFARRGLAVTAPAVLLAGELPAAPCPSALLAAWTAPGMAAATPAAVGTLAHAVAAGMVLAKVKAAAAAVVMATLIAGAGVLLVGLPRSRSPVPGPSSRSPGPVLAPPPPAPPPSPTAATPAAASPPGQPQDPDRPDAWDRLPRDDFDLPWLASRGTGFDDPRGIGLKRADPGLAPRIRDGSGWIQGRTDDEIWPGDGFRLAVDGAEREIAEVSCRFRIHDSDCYHLVALWGVHNDGKTCMFFAGVTEGWQYVVQNRWLQRRAFVIDGADRHEQQQKRVSASGDERGTWRTMRLRLDRRSDRITTLVDDRVIGVTELARPLGALRAIGIDAQTPYRGKALRVEVDDLQVRFAGEPWSPPPTPVPPSPEPPKGADEF